MTETHEEAADRCLTHLIDVRSGELTNDEVAIRACSRCCILSYDQFHTLGRLGAVLPRHLNMAAFAGYGFPCALHTRTAPTKLWLRDIDRAAARAWLIAESEKHGRPQAFAIDELKQFLPERHPDRDK